MTEPASTAPLYSVIIPVYNSEGVVAQTVRELIRFLKSRSLRYEILLVNDGSRDNSWKVIRSLAEEEKAVIAVNLVRNYGQHSAVFCGIHLAKGDFLITLDDDLQNPPDEIAKLIDKIGEGHDVVFARFIQKKHSLIRRIGSRFIGYLNVKIFGKPKDLTLTSFRILRRGVADRMKLYRTYFPYIPGLILLHSTSLANVDTEHHPRTIGTSNYSFWKIIELTARLLFSYSSFPLKFMTTVGFFISIASFGAGIFYIAKNFLVGTRVAGWTTVVVMLSFLQGFTIVMLGIMGEYLIRVLNQVSSSQSYHVREIVGSSESPRPTAPAQ